MENVFGSNLCLNGMLNDPLFFGCEEEEFLNDLGGSFIAEDLASPKAAKQASSHSSSLSGMQYDTGSDTAENFPSTLSGPLHITADCPQQMGPTSTAMAGNMIGTAAIQPMTSNLQNGQPMDSAGLLTQLLTTIQATTQQTVRTEAPRTSQPASSAGTVTLPSLTAQQQQALQAIMSLGSLGSTPEGKKVRRMLSNRESARRSRHRKQAHMHELETRVSGIEAENDALKLSVAKFQEQEIRYNSERAHLYAEIAALRSKVAQLEHTQASPMTVAQGTPCPPVDGCVPGMKRSHLDFADLDGQPAKRQAFCPV